MLTFFLFAQGEVPTDLESVLGVHLHTGTLKKRKLQEGSYPEKDCRNAIKSTQSAGKQPTNRASTAATFGDKTTWSSTGISSNAVTNKDPLTEDKETRAEALEGDEASLLTVDNAACLLEAYKPGWDLKDPSKTM